MLVIGRVQRFPDVPERSRKDNSIGQNSSVDASR